MVVTTEVGARHLADLVKQVQAGDEVLLTQDNKPVAKIVGGNWCPQLSISDALIRWASRFDSGNLAIRIGRGDVRTEMTGVDCNILVRGLSDWGLPELCKRWSLLSNGRMTRGSEK